jgi:CHAT domain-containing protein/Tfp pilus assembly protein PilF
MASLLSRGCAFGIAVIAVTTAMTVVSASMIAGDAWPVPAQSAAAVAPVDPLVEQLIAATPAERERWLEANSAAVTLELQRAISGRAFEMRRASKLDEAAKAYQALRAVTERRHDRAGLALSLVNYSAIPGQRADYVTALAVLNEALGIGESLGNNDVIAAALANLAIVYRLTGEFEHSLETNQRALEIAIASGDRATQGRVYGNLGIVYAAQGHYREALEVYEKAVALKESTSDAGDVALTLNNIGNIHREQGNLDLALGFYTRSLAILEKTNDVQSKATGLGNIGVIYRAMGKLDLAREYFQRTLALQESVGNRRGVATATYNLASILRLEGKRGEALAGYRASLGLREAIKDLGGIRESLDAISNLLYLTDQPVEALAMAQRAAAIARELKSNELLWQPLITVGIILEDEGEPTRAEAAYRESIEAIEKIRAEVAGGAEARRRFFEDKLAAYHQLTGLLLKTNRPAEALAIAERARGRVLSELLESAEVTVRPLTPAERDRQRGLEQEVVSSTARLSALERRAAPDTSGGKDVAEAGDRVRGARLASDEFRDALDARYPVRRLARMESPDASSSAGALLPDARTALVEFAVADEAIHLFVLTRADPSAVDRSPVISAFTSAIPRKELTARVEAYRRKLASRAPDYQTDARALYDLLLKPAQAVLTGHTRLIIVPDAALWAIPFETLSPASGRAVIDEASVTYAPSIAVLRAMHDRRLALESGNRSPRIVIAADPASDLAKLPEAEVQATALTALYGANRSRVFVGPAATEPGVRGALANATILHFATHGIVDDGNPMYSFLQLTRTGQIDANTDGRLEVWEIMSLKLDATVAVLTACDTARGSIGGGEGVVGLAWAFFAAGTPATVVSLWALESGSATSMTLEFHRRFRASLVAGHGEVAASLRAAALALRRDPRYRHPFYWAGLVAVGDGY